MVATWLFVILFVWLAACVLTEGEVFALTLILLALPFVFLWDLFRSVYRRWHPVPCHCGRMPPATAKWCPACGLDLREWREKGVKARRG
jgi:hypothetical protein